jgi:hypothetical protein
MPKKLLAPLLSAMLVLGAFAAAPAHASKSQESIFQDDRSLVFMGDAKRQAALDEIKALGATTVHSLVFWNSIAPDPNSKTKPAGFDGSDPNAYPAGAWDQYDALLKEATARGLQLLLSPVESPAWAGGCGNTNLRHHCRPNPAEFGAFVAALGKRYSGSFGGLPRVSRWSVWNEPNQSNWLYPQRQKVHGHIISTAAVIYRNLFRRATAALQATGHGGDQILLGETAPLGRTAGTLAKRFLTPVELYQGVFCLDSHGHKLRGRVAKDSGCSGSYAKLAATGVAHHPYNRGGSQPPLSKPASGEITISTLSRLTGVLSQGARAHRIASSLPVYLTEFGFQTNPPDKTFGVSLARQALWLNQSDYIAYRNSRVKSVSQYELFDEPDLGVFQTGLRFLNGSDKPSLAAYRLPIWVTRHGSGVRVWGQVRPADGAAQQVVIQNGNRSFKDVQTVTTAANGYFQVNVARQPGPKWRLAWKSPGGTTYTSRLATAR